MRDITVLLSASGSSIIPGIIKCFKNNGERDIRLVGMDMVDDPTCKYFVDSFYKVPAATTPDYCDIVLDICQKEKVDIYFPNISAEVSAVIRRKSDFEAMGVKLSISNQNSIDIANNKLNTYNYLSRMGIPVPKYYPIHSINDFMIGCSVMGYPDEPVCIKIVNESGSRGVRIIDDKKSKYELFAREKPSSFFISYKDMLGILNEQETLDEMMLVEYMPGIEYTVDLLADHGKVLYEVGRENVVSLMSIAQESIVSFDRGAYEIAEKIVNKLAIDGNFGFDFMRDKNGVANLMDINPRITATVSVIAVAGVNLPYLRVKQLLGEKLPNCRVDYGTRLKRRYLETFVNSNGELVRL